jgi:hypothetical protein
VSPAKRGRLNSLVAMLAGKHASVQAARHGSTLSGQGREGEGAEGCRRAPLPRRPLAGARRRSRCVIGCEPRSCGGAHSHEGHAAPPAPRRASQKAQNCYIAIDNSTGS